MAILHIYPAQLPAGPFPLCDALPAQQKGRLTRAGYRKSPGWAEAGPGLSPEPSSFLPITWCLGPTGEGRVLEMGLHGYWEQVHRVQLFLNRHWHQPDPGKGLACSRLGGHAWVSSASRASFLCRLSGPQNQGCEDKFYAGQQHTLKALTLPSGPAPGCLSLTTAPAYQRQKPDSPDLQPSVWNMRQAVLRPGLFARVLGSVSLS